VGKTDELQKVKLNVVTNEFCEKIVKKIHIRIVSSQMCTETYEKVSRICRILFSLTRFLSFTTKSIDFVFQDTCEGDG
jgi:hypothetical protein